MSEQLDMLEEPALVLPEVAIPDRAAEPTLCDCGHPWRFDPTLEGETCGGLMRAGWLVCDGCKDTRVTRRGRTVGKFKLAKSGRSLDADGFRLRAEGEGDPSELMTRLARLPELETLARMVARMEARSGADERLVAAARAALEAI